MWNDGVLHFIDIFIPVDQLWVQEKVKETSYVEGSIQGGYQALWSAELANLSDISWNTNEEKSNWTK